MFNTSKGPVRPTIRRIMHHAGQPRAWVRSLTTHRITTHRITKGLNALLLLAAIAGSACARAPAPQAGQPSDAQAVQSLPATVRTDAATLTVWSVPATGNSIRLQVRLAPTTPIGSGALEATAPAATVSPARFTLSKLSPPSTVRDQHSPPNPPALGKTYTYTFTVKAPAPGSYRVRLVLTVAGKRQAVLAIAVHI